MQHAATVEEPISGLDPGALAQARLELEVYGFTVLESLLPAAHAARLCALLDEADAAAGTDYVYDGALARHVANVPSRDDAFMALVDHPAVLDLVESVLGRDIILGSMNARILRPGDPDQGYHSDIPTVHRRAIGPPIMLQAVWMLDAFGDDNGATRIVPGSHRATESAPPPGASIPHVVAPTGPAGSVLVFDGQCWHGGGANRSSARRRAVFGHYRVGPWMRFQTDPAPEISVEQWERMTPRQRELMRMVHGVDQRNAADYYPEQFDGTRYD